MSECVISAVKIGADIKLNDKRSFLAKLGMLPDGPVEIRIVPATEARAIEANNHYFASLKEMVDHLIEAGVEYHTTGTLHAFFKGRYNGGRSTTQLSAPLFAVYTERCKAHAAAEWGVEFSERESLVGR